MVSTEGCFKSKLLTYFDRLFMSVCHTFWLRFGPYHLTTSVLRGMDTSTPEVGNNIRSPVLYSQPGRSPRRSYWRPRIRKALRHLFQDLLQMEQGNIRTRIPLPGPDNCCLSTWSRIFRLYVGYGESYSKRILPGRFLSRMHMLRDYRDLKLGFPIHSVSHALRD